MRILWLTHFVPYPATGHGALQRTHQLILQVAQHHEVSVVAIAKNRPDWAQAPAAKAFFEANSVQYKALYPERLGRRQRAAIKSSLGGDNYWEEVLYDERAAQEVAEQATSFRPDFLHLDTIFLAGYAGCSSARLVVTHHNIESELLSRRASNSGYLTRLFLERQARKTRHAEARWCGPPTVNVMVSEDDARVLKSFVRGCNQVTVPNGVDTDFFQPDLEAQPKRKSFVFAGGMDWYPNRIAMEWFAKELWPALIADDPSRTATIIGKAPPPSLTQLAARDSRVIVTGVVPDVRPFVAAAATYICPIHVGGGTRLKVLDALAMKKPLISTALGVSGLDLVAEQHYLGAETATEFVAQARRLEADPDLGRRLSANGREFVERNYSWAKTSRPLIDSMAISSR
jgi:polysaccharide biosynthesis protein PslH